MKMTMNILQSTITNKNLVITTVQFKNFFKTTA
jgi:hypothetical protein